VLFDHLVLQAPVLGGLRRQFHRFTVRHNPIDRFLDFLHGFVFVILLILESEGLHLIQLPVTDRVAANDGNPKSWMHVVTLAQAAHKFQVFDFRFSLSAAFFNRTYSFWAGLLGGCFLVTASHGTEQLIVQRLLAARNERDSRLALFSSWMVVFFQFALFLVIGLLLYAFYKSTAQAAPAVPERIYPEFIWHHLPVGLAGLVMAAILAAAMSNLSAALNALASTSIMDFLKPLRPDRAETYYLRLARWATVLWGAILFSVGLLARHWGRVLEAGLSIASVIYGALLGVFLLGVLTRRPGEWSAIIGMSAGFAATLLLRTHVAYTWYVLLGSSVTFAVGYCASLLLGEHDPRRVTAEPVPE
jgi:solute:Na+ symporter, SSS family